ncbi:MAG: hypothetical protein WBV28_10335, partial [Terracidiphilus sp.]
AGVAVALGLGLASFYIVPAAVEQRWVDIRQATDDPGYQVENNWLFARHANPALELHDLELLKASAIATTMLAVAFSGALVCWGRHRFRGNARWWIPLALIPAGILFLQFPLSDPLWNLLPKLRFLQFPWRWLVVLEAPMGIFFASAIWIAHRRWRMLVLFVSIAAFTTATLFAGFSFFQVCDEDDAVAGMLSVYHAGTGFEGTDEYAPPGADNSLLPIGLPEACLTPSPSAALGQGAADSPLAWSPDQHSCDSTFPAAPYPDKSAAEDLRVVANPSHDGFLILHLRSYPAWQVRINGQLAQDLPQRPDGLIALPVAAGPTTITADWTTTRDVQISRALTALALLLVTVLLIAERKPTAPRLS